MYLKSLKIDIDYLGTSHILVSEAFFNLAKLYSF